MPSPRMTEADTQDAIIFRPSHSSNVASRRLHNFGWLGIAALIGWLIYDSEVTDPLLLLLGSLIIVLGALPALRWARHLERNLPAFELLMLTAIPFYAVQIFQQHPATTDFPNDVLLYAALSVVLFQLCALGAHRITPARPLTHRIWRANLLGRRQRRLPFVGLAANLAFLFAANFTDLIPWEFLSVLRALFFGVGIVSAFLLARMWGARELSIAEKNAFAIGLCLQFIINTSGLYLISAGSLLLLALIGYVTESRKIPFAVAIAGFFFLAILHNGKSEMRHLYWNDAAAKPAFSQLPAFFTEWVGYGLTFETEEGEREVTAGILERSSLFHILCVVVDRTPSLKPHLEGETYRSIPFVLVPRVFWPDKPAPHDSNQLLAIQYGFSTVETAGNVSIAFGTPSEAYANFGLLGLAFLGAFYGLFFKKITGWAAACPPISFGGLVIVLLVAWSFQAEMILVVWLSSLFQATIALVGIPMAIKLAFNR